MGKIRSQSIQARSRGCARSRVVTICEESGVNNDSHLRSACTEQSATITLDGEWKTQTDAAANL